MTAFKIGDRVKVRPHYPFNKDCINKTATICHVDSDSIGLRFDFSSPVFHDCNDHCEENRGWYISRSYIQPDVPLVIEGDDDDDCI